MATAHIEFFVEPFSEGAPGPHVAAAVAAFESLGIATEVGPFGTTASGEVELLAQAVAVMIRDAAAAGATRIALRLERPGPESPEHESPESPEHESPEPAADDR
ncbi:MAG: thiamine-binding protein [bacterium]|nr:thiamine-binding protein [bacterium]MDE0669070.1 thiamine-binding protein [bacterium]